MGSTPEGTLYHAEYLTGREVALLLAAPQSSEATASRRELLERAVQIQQVNVAGIHEVGELGNGSLYVVGAHRARARSIASPNRLHLTPRSTEPPKRSLADHPFSGCGTLRAGAAGRAPEIGASHGRRT